MAFVFVGKEDAIDESVGALGGLDGFQQRFLAAAIDTVGQDDDGFAALLFFHDFVGSQPDRVVKKGAGTAAAVSATTTAATRRYRYRRMSYRLAVKIPGCESG